MNLKSSIRRLLFSYFVFASLTLCRAAEVQAPGFDATTERVGRWNTNYFVTPMNQILTPAGKYVELVGMRPQALALSPDGTLLATAGITHELVMVDPVSGNVLQRVPLPASAQEPKVGAVAAEVLDPDDKAQVSFTGLTFSPDGSRIYLSNVNGDLKVFSVQKDGKVTALRSFPLPHSIAPQRTNEIPAGIAVSPDGSKLYVALNLSDRLAELDAVSGKVLRQWSVGVAPFGVVLAGKKIYVSNWGGRRPGAGTLTGPAGRGMLVRVDPVRNIANEGSVSVIDLTQETDASAVNNAQTEIICGLHASGLALSANGRYLAVANAGSDTVSVIDARKDVVVETICTRQSPGDVFGAQPNALTFDKSGKTLYVCNGTQNAVAVLQFNPGKSKLLGLIPVGWFPGAVIQDANRKMLYVANIKGLTSGQPRKSNGQTEFSSKSHQGSLSLLPVPTTKELAEQTHIALANLRYPLLAQAKLPARAGQPTRPVPERVGEPSVFKHVIYIIKENRTYDQVLGDVKEGDGDADLCTFGEKVTPNIHKLVHEFVLLDNTYCSGVLSADGHQWTDTGLVTDYLERSFAGFPRSYPSGGDGDGTKDALAYSPAGFIWDNVLAHGKTMVNFGEFSTTRTAWKESGHKGKPTFLDFYHQYMEGTDKISISCEPDIETLRPYLVTNTAAWNLDIPDQFRASQFIKSLNQYEQAGKLPDFVLMWLPNDHTSAAKAGSPKPASQVADNDLALGRIVEAVSHSQFWKDTCIMVIEDDPQNGWDHVSGFRTTAYVISPYTKRGQVIKTQYNQPGMLRTMELMLGLPPMNQLDATATPMFDCFTDQPDFTPYTSVPNQVPLDDMNKDPKKTADAQLRKDAYVSARLKFEKADQCPEDVLNRILWRAMKGPQTPYPEWAVKVVDEDD